jgi:hypothetical protein
MALLDQAEQGFVQADDIESRTAGRNAANEVAAANPSRKARAHARVPLAERRLHDGVIGQK